MEFSKEKCAMLIIKRGIKQIMEGTELTNLKRTRRVVEKEKYKSLGITESGQKRKQEKRTPDEREDLAKPSSTVEISSKE